MLSHNPSGSAVLLLGVLAVATGCSKKPCGPATAPAIANDYVLAGGRVCRASEQNASATVSINYPDLDEAALETKYKTELGAKGFKVVGKNGIFFVSKGNGTPNMVTTLRDKDHGGASAVVKVFE